MKLRQKHAHMTVAKTYSQLSYCSKRKVGCLILKDNVPIGLGWNGTAPGEDNTCEDCNGSTMHDKVTHAEENALDKIDHLIRLTGSKTISEGAIMFVTTAPCFRCAQRIVKYGVSEVYYDEMYKNEEGVQFLQDNGVKVEQLR